MTRVNQMLMGLFLILTLSDPCLAQSNPKLTSFKIENGKIAIKIDAPAGELIVQSTGDLQPDNWTQLSRLQADGSTKDFNDPFDPNTVMKFYRVYTVPPADELHLTGEFASALEAALTFSDLQNTFGLNFPEGEAVIPAGNDLSFSTRNTRIYAAVIAVLSTLVKDVSDAFPPESRPSAATIAAALANDIADGNLDGKNNGAPVQIGTTGTFLPAFTEQDFENALNEVKAAIPGLYNVFFTGAGAAAAAPLSGSEISFTIAASGTFAPSTPAIWGDFYWGSSDWQ